MTTSEDNTAEKANYATGPIDWEATAEMWKERAAVLRERVAELEAVIQKARDAAQRIENGEPLRARVIGALDSVPSTVLAAVKRETAAQALEQFADSLGVDVSDDDSDELRGYRNGQRQALRKATARAAALRSGTEGSRS